MKELPSPERAQTILEDTVKRYDRYIKMIRSYLQHRENRALRLEMRETFKVWDKEVREKSGGMLSCSWGELNTIDIESWNIDTGHTFFQADPKRYSDSYRWARGYSFLLRHPEVEMEVLLFDGGGSSKPFDDMEPSLKPEFAKHFGERGRGPFYTVSTGRSPIYVAVGTDDHDGYRITTIAEAYPMAPLDWELEELGYGSSI